MASALSCNLVAMLIPLAMDFKSLLLRGLACRRLWRGVRLSFVIGERLHQNFIRLRLLTPPFLALRRLMGALFRDGRSLARRTAIACKTTEVQVLSIVTALAGGLLAYPNYQVYEVLNFI